MYPFSIYCFEEVAFITAIFASTFFDCRLASQKDIQIYQGSTLATVGESWDPNGHDHNYVPVELRDRTTKQIYRNSILPGSQFPG